MSLVKATCHRGAKKHHTACASSENTTYMRFLNFRAKESICNLIKKYTFGIKHFISQNNVSWASSNTLKPFDVGGSGNSYLFSFSITFSPDIHACYKHVLLMFKNVLTGKSHSNLWSWTCFHYVWELNLCCFCCYCCC